MCIITYIYKYKNNWFTVITKCEFMTKKNMVRELQACNSRIDF